ncbi:efflux RND transporter periplasmic adaptor subunit [Polaribacter sp. Q13]|uniref:efflux RND transporter periplasmic adaptor subunit n=1 Tax=Polaribacter sp. Q13 TaxID=2806551 RepID=UPI00193C691C|nr:efflux RND transporter periplasmic adaptor subunit [Polaribacter sp. Q13]QVY67098.1 efflux RND transporter periplasmic adaptor subunit [Polaribacter sp. Q13]
MKKYSVYIGLIAVGLLLGWMLFGGNSNTEEMHKHDAVAETNQMWTCSMHPQIMQPEAGDCPICGMDLIPAASSAEGLSADQFKLSENAMALANIQTTIVGENSSDADTGFVLSGKITENEDETATMPAHFDGRVEKLFVNSLGQQVNKGQAVAQIYSPELIAAQQELITAYKLKASQPQLYNAVKNKFKNWMIHGAQLDEVEQTGKVKNSFTIYSHVSGVVTEIAINEGSHIMDGKPIFKVSNLNTVWANFDVYENKISQFKKGQDVVVTTNAYPNKTFKGKVNFIDPILDTQTRTVNLRVVLNNKKELFKPGMFVEGKMKSMVSVDEKQAITIPASAVLWTGKRSVVYLKTNPNEPVFEMKEITLGNQIGANYQVLEGLNNGDEIVTNGTFTVDAAAQLQGKKSMMNKTVKSEPISLIGTMKMKFPLIFKNEFKTTLPLYFSIKDALIASDYNKVSKLANTMLQKALKINLKGLSQMELVHFNKTVSMLKAISENNTIEKQRAHFVILNENIVAIAMNMDNLESTLYVQKCPMANNNKGAMWMSTEKDIRNPYYGETMMTCGSIIEEIN